jgi:hypothetical protein
MKKWRRASLGFLLSSLFLVVFLASLSHGQGVTVGKDGTFRVGELTLPYAFYNQNFGASAGFVYGASGWPQRQATILGTIHRGHEQRLGLLRPGKGSTGALL